MTEEEKLEDITVRASTEAVYGIKEEFVPTAVFENADHDGNEQSDVSESTKQTTEADAIESVQTNDESVSQVEDDKTVTFEQENVDREENEDDKKLKKRRMSRRKSYRRRRLSTMQEGRISGDFSSIETDAFGSARSPTTSISSYHEKPEDVLEEGEMEEEEEEVEEEEELEVVTAIDRNYYYSLYRKLLPERNTKRIKNNYLQRKMADYFKKRKMDHVLKETDQQVDSQQKYDKKLDALADLKDLDARERNSITAELNDMRIQKEEHLSLFNTHFASMQHREKDIGSGLINTKTGKPLSEKVVERLIRRQRDKMLEIASMRLVYIKLRDRITEKKIAIHKLDTIGDNLHLIDYEQLKMENTSHTDKIEERDDDLIKLRVKCSQSMQCLAHVREKSAALQLDLTALTNRYEDIKSEALDCRERLNNIKLERDKYRLNIVKIIDESGLLTKTKLLIDMEESLEEIKTLENQIEKHKNLYEKTRESLKAIKINIKNTHPKRILASLNKKI
ncbi:hypothetical protein RN001_013573 [Aquatica leii]|uniref:CCDC113/CCDC96 coiled-coil domain-containing protein n=1 Tax=Aquatica leii TaxID=1421715 RepID=A0AAN7SLN5_9COLE|nr:hypothetical protein RN001_013573 [Aquatica leii]